MLKQLLFILALLLTFALPSQAATYVNNWASGDYVYSSTTAEQDWNMSVHTQQAIVQLYGPTGSQSAYSGFGYGTRNALVAATVADGWFNTYGEGEVWCSYANMLWSESQAYRSDKFGTSYICLQKVPSTCTPPHPITGWITCTYVPIAGCNVNCAASTAALIVGASAPTYQYKKRWRQTPAGLDCYGNLQLVGPGCSSCSQTSDF